MYRYIEELPSLLIHIKNIRYTCAIAYATHTTNIYKQMKCKEKETIGLKLTRCPRTKVPIYNNLKSRIDSLLQEYYLYYTERMMAILCYSVIKLYSFV